MSDLLLSGNLNSPQAGVEVRALARARTLTALRVLDPARKGILLQFLYESNLIGYETLLLTPQGTTQITLHKTIIGLVGADLSRTELPSEADLSGVELVGTNLDYANLSDINLDRADLLSAHLYEANLHHAGLSRVNLKYASLDKTILTDAFLEDADLSLAYLEDANLMFATLINTSFNKSDLME